MKVHLSGKEYVCNLEGFGFEPMLPHFFYQLFAPDGDGGGGPTWMRHRVVGPHGGGRPVGVVPTTMVMVLN
jgi:hypothetical protein